MKILIFYLITISNCFSYYGVDNRRDFYESPSKYKNISNSIPALIRINESDYADNKSIVINMIKYPITTNEKYCSNFRFLNQPLASFCTAALIAPDVVLTAGHCLETCTNNIKIIFDYKFLSRDQNEITIPSEKIYACQEVLARSFDFDAHVDYAIVKLDRVVKDRMPLQIEVNPSRAPRKVYTVGYPLGMPMKISTNGHTLKDKSNFFTATLDVLQGNSGSPVINQKTNKIEGILSLGIWHLRKNYHKNCLEEDKISTFLVPKNKVSGATVSKNNNFLEQLKMLGIINY